MNLKPRVQRIALAGGLFFILSTAHLFTPGQFMDGATYAAVSRNLAMGLGVPGIFSIALSSTPILWNTLPSTFGFNRSFFDSLATSGGWKMYTVCLCGSSPPWE